MRVGDLVFASGQGGFGDDGTLVSGGFEPQLRQAFRNLEQALSSCNANLASVARMTVYIVDPSHYEIFKEVRRDVLSAPFPASTAVAVAELLSEGMLVEVEAVATVAGRRLLGHSD